MQEHDIVGLTGSSARLMFAGRHPPKFPPVFDGVERKADVLLLRNFADNLHMKLVMGYGNNNSSLGLLVPMAIRYPGVMHAILCLSGWHLMEATLEAIPDRRMYHHQTACRMLAEDLEAAHQSTEWASLVREKSPSCDAFLLEYFNTYHRIINVSANPNVSTSLNVSTTLKPRPAQLNDDLRLPQLNVQYESGSFLGDDNALLMYILKITELRDTIRLRMHQKLQYIFSIDIVDDAVNLENSIRTWTSAQKVGSTQDIESQLYRQCAWIYLYRSFHCSEPHEQICIAVDEGLAYLRQIVLDTSTHRGLLIPLFLLGCAAFLPNQRREIRLGFGKLKRYSRMIVEQQARELVEQARDVVEKVWAKMDKKDPTSWDWKLTFQKG